MKEQVCRYCGRTFLPEAKKPGYINECPTCLYEKTAPAAARTIDKAIGEAKQNIERYLSKAKVPREIIEAALEGIEGTRPDH